MHMKSVMGFLAMPVKIRLRLDSSAAKAVCQRIGVGRIRHLEVRSLWLQSKVRDKEIVVFKQDGETNISDIGTKNLAGPRFKWMREQIGRVLLGDTSKIEEAKAVRVNMITGSKGSKGSSDMMQKIGCALVVLMDCMTRATAAAVDGECDSRLDSEASSELATFSILFIIAVIIFVAGFLLGKTSAPAVVVVKSLGTQAEETYPGPERLTASRVCPASEAQEVKNFEKHNAAAMAARCKETQSQTTYARWKKTPRFVPLGEHAHGCWPG